MKSFDTIHEVFEAVDSLPWRSAECSARREGLLSLLRNELGLDYPEIVVLLLIWRKMPKDCGGSSRLWRHVEDNLYRARELDPND
jgi:hypothetical protein